MVPRLGVACDLLSPRAISTVLLLVPVAKQAGKTCLKGTGPKPSVWKSEDNGPFDVAVGLTSVPGKIGSVRAPIPTRTPTQFAQEAPEALESARRFGLYAAFFQFQMRQSAGQREAALVV